MYRGRRKHKYGVATVTLVALGLVLTLGISSAQGGSNLASTPSTPAQQPLVIGYSDPYAAAEGLRSIGYGAKQAIKALGLNWKIRELDSKLSANQQVSDIDTFVSLNVDAIMTWTLDPGAAEAAYQRARKAGIPLIGIGSKSKTFLSEMAPVADTTCVVAKEQAAYVAKRIPGAKFIAIGGPPVPSITLTTNCFLAAAKKAGLKLLEVQNDTTGSQAGGQRLAQDMLTKHPDTQVIWAQGDEDAIGAAAALRATGKSVWSGKRKGVIIITRNGTTQGAAAIRSGNLTVSWDNNYARAGAGAIQVLEMLLVDKVAASKIPRRVQVPAKRYDLSNISQYRGPLVRKVPLLKIKPKS